MQELVTYWRNAYDWESQVALLNSRAQFTTEIGGQRIHFVHHRSANRTAFPLVLIHGWPSTFYDCYNMIPRLEGTAAVSPWRHGSIMYWMLMYVYMCV